MGDGVGTIDASLGNFGHITYGQTIIGTVVYPTPWDPSTATAANVHGCEPLNWGDFSQLYSTNSAEETRPYSLFVLLERGHCSNPTKVRNVENFGGAVALIADYKDEDVDSLIMTDY